MSFTSGYGPSDESFAADFNARETRDLLRRLDELDGPPAASRTTTGRDDIYNIDHEAEALREHERFLETIDRLHGWTPAAGTGRFSTNTAAAMRQIQDATRRRLATELAATETERAAGIVTRSADEPPRVVVDEWKNSDGSLSRKFSTGETLTRFADGRIVDEAGTEVRSAGDDTEVRIGGSIQLIEPAA